MDTTTLKRILLVYNIVLMIISGLAITLGIIVFFVSLALPFIVPPSVAHSALAGGAIVMVVGLLGFLASWLKGQNERRILPLHIVGLVVVIAVQVYITYVLIANHSGSIWSIVGPIYDPLGIVYGMFGGYKSIITVFGKYIAILVIILTIPQMIAIYVAVQILTAKTNFLPNFPVIFRA